MMMYHCSVFILRSQRAKIIWQMLLFWGIGLLYFVATPVYAQPAAPHLVKDINSQTPSAYPGPFVSMNGFFYFGAEDPIHGQALWRSDGTEAGTTLVKSIDPTNDDAIGSVIAELINFNGVLFFEGRDSNNDTELWKSDGTTAGTVRVKDINPSDPSNPSGFTIANNALYFVADDGVHGAELWRSDGTEAGTLMVKDINPTAAAGIYDIVTLGDELYFFADDGVNGREVWKSDGTSAGTLLVKDITTSGNSDSVARLEVIGTTLYFFQTTSTAVTLWKSDGTIAGTQPVKVLISGATYGLGYDLVVSANTLYFWLEPENSGSYQLWKSNGTAAGTVKIMDFDGTSGLALLGNTLFIDAKKGVNGYELWKSDGTATGTVLVKDINPGVNSAYPQSFVAVGSTLYFWADDGQVGRELWKSDGTTRGTTFVKDINSGPSPSSAVEYLPFVMNNRLYFQAFGNNMGYELWRSDGTTAGTNVVKDISASRTGDALPRIFSWVGDTLYFGASTDYQGQVLWKSDGTITGTLPVKDIRTTNSDADFSNFVELNGILYFVADDGIHGEEVWRSDGTPTGTKLLKDINPGFYGSFPEHLTVYNQNLYFIAEEDTHGYELWKSDGTAAGTVLLKDIVPGTGSSHPYDLSVINGALYFFAGDSNSIKPWISDGTTGGTHAITALTFPDGAYLTNLNGVIYFFTRSALNQILLWKIDGTSPDAVLVTEVPISSYSVLEAISVNGLLYFTGVNNNNEQELWKSNGTASGTVLLKTISAQMLTNVNGTLYFAGSNAEGDGLWKSDGTSSGTVLVKNVSPLFNIFFADGLLAKNDQVFFMTEQDQFWQLWVSDGSASGTFPIADMGYPFQNPNDSFYPTFTIHGDKLYYPANDGTTGMELWSLAIPQNTLNAVDDNYVVAEDNRLSIAAPGLLGNDSGHPSLSVTLKNRATNGNLTLQADGSFTYSPTTNFNGVDNFTYILSNGALTDTGTVNLTVTPVNDAPMAGDDSATLEAGQSATIPIFANDSDVDGDPLTLASYTSPAHGVVSILNNTLSYQADVNYSGPDSFSYTINDGNGGTASATVTLTITPAPTPTNHNPVAGADLASTNAGQAVTIAVLNNDSDVDGDTLTIASLTQPTHGMATLNGNQVVYTPAANFNGTDTFSYTLSDGKGGAASATVTVSVTATSSANHLPVAVADSVTTQAGMPVTITVLANDSDPDGDNLTLATITQPTNGTALLQANQIIYTPAVGFTGTDLINYTLSDGRGGNASASVTITVNKALVINSDADGDGLLNSVECSAGAACPDHDGDGVPDEQDIDSDGDGIPDATESNVANAVDAAASTVTPADTDGDGVPDYLDTDSDNDSVPDAIEGHDANRDGIADITPVNQDTDKDGLDDAYDTVTAPAAGNATGAKVTMLDPDNDKLVNYLDAEDNGDGIPTRQEVGADPLHPTDGNGNGIPDYLETKPSPPKSLFLPLVRR